MGVGEQSDRLLGVEPPLEPVGKPLDVSTAMSFKPCNSYMIINLINCSRFRDWQVVW